MKDLAIIACGGRDYADRDAVHRALSRLIPRLKLVIQGEAKGADTLARDWATAHGVETLGFKADWDRWGKKAGMLRNNEMLAHLIHLGIKEYYKIGVVAFPGGIGTAGMCSIAARAGVKVWQPVKAL